MRFKLWRDAIVVLITALGLALAVPSFFDADRVSSWPTWAPKNQFGLGLDLSGGIFVLLHVDKDDLLATYREELRARLVKASRDAGLRREGFEDRERGSAIRISGDEVKAARIMAAVAMTDPQGIGAEVSEYIIDLGDGWFEIGLTEEELQRRIIRAAERSAEVIRSRIDALGTTEPTVQVEGGDAISVQLPGFFDRERLETVLGSTARLSFRMVDESVSPGQARIAGAPAGSDLLPEYRADGSEPGTFYVIRRKTEIAGEDVADAQGGIHPETGRPVVNFRLNSDGAARFSAVTSRNVGRRFAIVLDEAVVSAPVINQHIPGGAGFIEGGDFTQQYVNDFAALLRSGALPARLEVGASRKVGASLGADSIEGGKRAAMIGVLLVVLFMVLIYGAQGVIASFAVLVNLGLIFGVLSLIGATLTLPGIAGLVLTVGMAVDANVLIIERAREEFREGKAFSVALENGFSRAFITIFDANLTTLVAAAALFQLGSGPVRGFAVTLVIGIASTLFSAYALTRLFTVMWVVWFKPKTLVMRAST